MHTRAVVVWLLLLLGVSSALACKKPRRCLFIGRQDKLVVTVHDAETKASICDAHVFIGRLEGADRPELPVNESCVHEAYLSVPDGGYVVDVSHPDYASAHREGIQPALVDTDECGPESIANVDVELERASK